MRQEFILTTRVGPFAVFDYGGSGPDVLMLHDLSINAAALDGLGEALREAAHVRSFDQRSHGHTEVELTARDQLFCDVGAVSEALGLWSPVLVGEGYGAWIAVSATLSGYVEPAALVLLGASGFALPRAESTDVLTLLTDHDFLRMMSQRFGWGASGRLSERDGHVDRVDAQMAKDWLYAGVETGTRRRVLERSVVAGPQEYLHKPTAEQMAAATRLTEDMDPYPCAESFARLRVPVLLVEGHELVSGRDLESAQAFVAGADNRDLHILEEPAYVSRSASPTVAAQIFAFLQRHLPQEG